MIKTTSTPVLFRPWDETQSDQNQDLLLAPFADMSQRGRSAETPLITDMSQRGRSAETPLITDMSQRGRSAETPLITSHVPAWEICRNPINY